MGRLTANIVRKKINEANWKLNIHLQLPSSTHQLAPGDVVVADGRCQVEHGAGAQRPQRLGHRAKVLRWELGASMHASCDHLIEETMPHMTWHGVGSTAVLRARWGVC